MEPQAAGEWFHCKVFNTLWRHFYGLLECKPWKIVVDLFFTITFIFSFLRKITRDMLQHFHGIYSHRQ